MGDPTDDVERRILKAIESVEFAEAATALTLVLTMIVLLEARGDVEVVKRAFRDIASEFDEFPLQLSDLGRMRH